MNLSDYLVNIRNEFAGLKKLADRAMAQTTDEDFFRLIDPNANSIGHIVKHISGNQFSRWTDFLTSDGEKENRQRDSEFELYESDSREVLLERWESGWQVLFETLDSLLPDDLDKKIKIRGEDHAVYAAINRQLTHYGAHVGEIVLLAKHFTGDNWQTLSIAKGESEAFNKKKFSQQ